uniref:Predicted protein n=1 Tax=Physcomitrium patens TaxID=3218 RepID=A9U0A4_PHYPA
MLSNCCGIAENDVEARHPRHIAAAAASKASVPSERQSSTDARRSSLQRTPAWTCAITRELTQICAGFNTRDVDVGSAHIVDRSGWGNGGASGVREAQDGVHGGEEVGVISGAAYSWASFVITASPSPSSSELRHGNPDRSRHSLPMAQLRCLIGLHLVTRSNPSLRGVQFRPPCYQFSPSFAI